MLGWIAAAVVSFFVLGYLHARLIGWTLAAGLNAPLKQNVKKAA